MICETHDKSALKLIFQALSSFVPERVDLRACELYKLYIDERF